MSGCFITIFINTCFYRMFMPKSLRERLLEKGWTEDEIENTQAILFSRDIREKHVSFQKTSHPILYWASLIVAIIGNFLLSVTLIPFLMILGSAQVYMILGLVGVVFGAMFNLVLKDLEHIDDTHHVVAGIFIPAMALITIYLMASVANRFNEIIQNPNPHNALVLSLIYLFCFSAPYAFYKVKDLWYHRKHARAHVL